MFKALPNFPTMKLKVFFSFCLICFWGIAQAQVQVPEQLIGNWVQEKNNIWEFGFYEHFAVYEAGFWEYETIIPQKKGVQIRLRKGDRTETLEFTFPKKTGAPLTLASKKTKAATYRQTGPGFTPFATADQQPFKNSGFKTDTVTLIGYYRNYGKLQEVATSAQQKGPFKVSVPNFILDKSVEYYADIDSLGRFSLKFPVLNTQQVYIDWGRLTQMDVVEPGETLFLYADMADFIPKAPITTREEMMAFRNSPKHTQYMGPQARLHKEISHYTASQLYFDRTETLKNVSSDMGYMAAAKANHEARVLHLQEYIDRYPTLSDRFKTYQFAFEKYQLAFNLMQHRFEKRSDGTIIFDDGYLEFIEATMDFDKEELFTLIREYSSFMRDYVGYTQDIKRVFKDEAGKVQLKFTSVNHADAWDVLRSQGFFNEDEIKILEGHTSFLATVSKDLAGVKDTATINTYLKSHQQTFKTFEALQSRPDVSQAVMEVVTQLLAERSFSDEIDHIDSLVQHTTLKELLLARSFYQSIDKQRLPLSKKSLLVLEEKITKAPIKDVIKDINNHYVNLGNKEISYLASLKNTDHLKEAKDAEALFSALIAPYKGKVIYLDFWGTWCGPCREQMPFATAVKKEFAGKEVVFMYLANRSPEKSWLNVIKQMDLVGENVVHYRLPEEQQAMIERKFAVNSFPTYMLIDKDGKMATGEAPRPELKNQLVTAIDLLLAK